MTTLRRLRREAGLTQKELCRMAGLTVPRYSALENGHSIPRKSTAARLAAILRCDVADLLPVPDPRPTPTGYQQGILLALGCMEAERFRVRCQDRFYPEQVRDIFGTTVFEVHQRRPSSLWCVRSALVRPPKLEDVTDWKGFSRAWIEIHGSLVPITQHIWKSKVVRHVPGLKVYGPYNVLEAVMTQLPVSPKKLQRIVNDVDGGKYIGRTSGFTLQKHDTVEVLDWIDGFPRNEAIWTTWQEKIARINSMDK